MTLQFRLTIALVAVITTVVTVAGIFAVTSAERELVDVARSVGAISRAGVGAFPGSPPWANLNGGWAILQD